MVIQNQLIYILYIYVHIYVTHFKLFDIKIYRGEFLISRMEWSLEFRHMLQMFCIALRIDLNIAFVLYMTITIKKQPRK